MHRDKDIEYWSCIYVYKRFSEVFSVKLYVDGKNVHNAKSLFSKKVNIETVLRVVYDLKLAKFKNGI